MKFKRIQKFQGGGGFGTFTPVIDPMPTAPVQQTPQQTKAESSIDDDLYKDLVGKGLVNDVNYFVQQIAEIESDPLAYLNPSNRTKTLQLVAKINEIKQNKLYWDQAVKRATDNGGLNEAAIGSQGELFVKQEGGISKISMGEYSKSPEKYNILSVSELLNARQYDPNLTFNKSVFTVAEHSIGLNKIVDHIKSAIGLIAEAGVTSEKVYSKEQITKRLKASFGKAPTEAEKRGLQALLEIAETPGDYVKVYRENSGKRHNIDKALGYIWNTLNTNAQRKLNVAAIQNGKKNPKEIVWDILITATEPSSVVKYSPVAASTVEGAGAKDKVENLTMFQMFHKDKLAVPGETFAFNDPNLKVLFRGSVGATGPLVTQKDDQIGFSTLGDILRGFGYGRFLESDKAYFGKSKIGLENLNNVIYDGETAAKVYMPVGRDGMPDYDAFQDFKKIYKEFEENKDSWSTADAERHFRNNGYRLNVDQVRGEKIIRDNEVIKPFLVMYGYTNDATGLDTANKDSNIVHKLTRNEEKAIVPMLEQVWTIGTGKNKVNLTPDDAFGEDYYKGIVTIPYRKAATAIVDAIVGQGALEKINSIGVIQNNIRNSSNLPMNTNNSADVLKNN